VNIIYFGNDWFAENRTSSHHIARRLAQRHQILYVDSPGFRAPQATARDARKIYNKLKGVLRNPRPVHENIWHVVVPQVPYRSVPGVRTANRMTSAYLVRRAARHLGFDRYLLWFATPDLGPLAGHLDEDLVVYYCTDLHTSLPHVDEREMGRIDEDLTKRADQVFVCSNTLLDQKRKLNPTTLYSPHGVDVDLFRQACDPGLTVADHARHLRHPVIGYFGLVGNWIDLDLIQYLAKARPEWTFLFVGLVNVDVSALTQYSNIVFVGQQPYMSLPTWAKAFDVALYPARPTGFSLNANPLKIREYLAAGKPVVSIPTVEVQRLARWVRIATTPEAFLHEIEDALKSDSDELRQSRIQAISDTTWEARVAEVWDVVEKRLRAVNSNFKESLQPCS
jgi:glycosyltransferase involved in cell wall biosynthesis